MIGNNFTLHQGGGFNPLFPLYSHNGEKEFAETCDFCPASQLLVDELSQLGITPDNPFFCFTNELAHYSFHIIANVALAAKREEELIAAACECEELEIEPINIWQHPERAAWAMQNQTFVALKKIEGQKKLEAKWSPKWAELIGKGKFKQFKLKDEKGEPKKIFQQHEIELTSLTAEEVEHISTLTFKAVGIVHQIRNIEQERREAAVKAKKDQKEIKKKETQFTLHYLQARLKAQWKQCCLKFNVVRNSRFSSHQQLLEQRMQVHQEEMREQQRLIEKDEHKARIIKRDIEQVELKREIIKGEVKRREIKRRQVASVDLAARKFLGNNSICCSF
jgi:hypothetical protein